MDNSHSGATTHEIPDARTDCNAVDSDMTVVGEKKLLSGECSNFSCSNTSVDCDERTNNVSNNNIMPSMSVNKLCRVFGYDFKAYYGLPDSHVRFVDAKNDVNNTVRKRNIKRSKRKKSGGGAVKSPDDGGNCSSLVELDLDWLFDSEQHRKGLSFFFKLKAQVIHFVLKQFSKYIYVNFCGFLRACCKTCSCVVRSLFLHIIHIHITE